MRGFASLIIVFFHCAIFIGQGRDALHLVHPFVLFTLLSVCRMPGVRRGAGGSEARADAGRGDLRLRGIRCGCRR